MTAGAHSRGIPAGWWRKIRDARHRLLMLDYDGTLAPLTVERAEARPAPATLTRLRALAGCPGTKVVIVSGRPLAELERLLDFLPLHMFGEHGWEERRTRGRIVRHPLPAAAAAALVRAERIARRRGWTAHLERKRSALVIHTRALERSRARAVARAVQAAWAAAAARGGLKLEPIRGGVELRAAARDKGGAVRSLVARAPRGTLVMYVGDDRTDEDAFRALRPHGLGVRVGPPARDSHADARIAGTRAVSEFLARWLRVTQEPRAARRRARPGSRP